jgi:hypothetical protein
VADVGIYTVDTLVGSRLRLDAAGRAPLFLGTTKGSDPLISTNAMTVRYLKFDGERKANQLYEDLGISGTPGFIVGTELVPGALDVERLKELIAWAGEKASRQVTR